MKNFSQCLMCKYAFGRTCKLKNAIISDEIYQNEKKCDDFKSLQSQSFDVDDSCCNENSKYYEKK